MPDWPADGTKRWPLGRLVPYARNARTHSDAQVAQIAASIDEFGFTNPTLDGDGRAYDQVAAERTLADAVDAA